MKVKVNAKDLREVGSAFRINVQKIKEELDVLDKMPSKIDGHWRCTTWDTWKGSLESVNGQMKEIKNIYEPLSDKLFYAAEQ